MLKIKNFIIKYKVQIILLIIFIASAISIYIQDKDRKESFLVNSNEIESKTGKIGVYISGAIKKEGVYYLEKESRVTNLIDMAGGLTQDADVSKINPAQKLNDSDKIIIPNKSETNQTDSDNNDTDNIEDNTNFEEDDENVKVGNKININTASKDELKSLNGIGEATANKIINYRKTNPFREIEDIMNVPGIGESKFNNIKNDICI